MPEATQSRSTAEGLQAFPLRAFYTANSAVMEQRALAANPGPPAGQPWPAKQERRMYHASLLTEQMSVTLSQIHTPFLRRHGGAAVHPCDL